MAVRPVGGPQERVGPAQSSTKTATVRVGEKTMGDVAQRVKVPEQSLRSANPQIKNPNDLRVGQEVKLPEPQQQSQAPAAQPGDQAPSPAQTQTPTPPPARQEAPAPPPRGSIQGSLREAQVRGQEPTTSPTPPPAGYRAAPSLDDATAGRGVLRRGQGGESVSELQRRLNDSGTGPPLDVDGKFGERTEAAVRQYQQDNGLQVDGKVGPETMRGLNVPTSGSLRRDPAFQRLNENTRREVLTRMDAPGMTEQGRTNLSELATTPGFSQLNQGHQRQMLEIQGRAPADRQLTRDLTGLANSRSFRNLNDGVKTNALQEIGRHPSDATARATVSQLVRSPGFGRLSDAHKNRMLDYVGGTNPLSQQVRPQLQRLMNTPAYRNADAAGQSRQLSNWLSTQPAAPGLVANMPATASSRRPYTVHGPTDVASHAFASGNARARRYEVEVDGRRIPVFMPRTTGAGHHSIDQVARSIAALPASSRRVVTRVNVNPGRNPHDGHWARVYRRPGFRSYMTAGSRGQVDIYPSTGRLPSQSQMDQSMIHETGHTLSNQQWGDRASDRRWNTWQTAARNDGIVPSRYATASPQEDFAETLVLYQRVRGTPQEAEVRAMMPERFRILDRMTATPAPP